MSEEKETHNAILEPEKEEKKKKKKYNRTSPSLREERLFKLMLKESKKKGKPRPMSELMQEAGYAKTTSRRPQQVVRQEAFQQLKRKYAPAERGFKVLYDLSDEGNEDKQIRFKSAVEILKLNDAYPTQKKAIVQLFDKVSNVFGGDE